ncbi:MULTISPECIES: hypothetical protein [unclassified Bradyrhizobium]|uniref:hypothetical protein n=1 Tax=unclassified Bradyrhizobium TaxID=2631580 RepID=UPI0020B1BD75|nr:MULTISPECIES: hypothetical protein [unclassified Bradyrhizobium]MCP3402879.1 hypothetical protein [Bradyrhizobium sp. CCGB20]MCP3411355.1 hypothetical protein [Bradyrhizobium sp. CCGB01]
MEVELKFVRNANAQAMPVIISPNAPNAIRVTLSEEDMSKRYPWDYHTLKVLWKTPDFKENERFH